MYSYIIGKLTYQEGNIIVLENNGIGYEINVSNPFSYELNNEYKVYLYNNVKEEEYTLFGFKSLEEKQLFLKLIGVKGLGPKIALAIMATGSISGIVDAIERENLLYLKKFPKVGEKLAKQIILDLKGKIHIDNVGMGSNDNSDELVSVLESLGYKTGEIKRVLPQIDTTKSVEEQIKEALRLMLK
ncbi:MAG: Holliday junction branch migration protein RuvA [Bacilli bacterium]|nr:Holliday junction branch migration protein RuvA [Bacilli bacterium]